MPTFKILNGPPRGGKNSKKKHIKPVEGFGNIQYNIPEDVALSKKVDESDVFDKPKNNKGTALRSNKGTNKTKITKNKGTKKKIKKK